MTFDQLRQQVLDYCNLTSNEAQTRVGKAINRHYRRVTSQLGLEATRFVVRAVTTTPGVGIVTFPQIEKIDRLIDTTDALAARLLPEVSLHTLRTTQPGAAAATCWALQTADADSVTVRLDTVPQAIYSLQADGWTALADLVGSDAPAFPESFHDILAWFVIAEELLKKEKGQLATAYEGRAERLLADLRFHLADSPTKDTRQRSAVWSTLAGSAGASSGGGGNLGGTSYTQSGLITFDRGPGAPPFAVGAGSAVVPDLDADKVDGLHAADVIAAAVGAAATDVLPIDLASEVTGRLPLAHLPTAAANTLLGRRDGSPGDREDLTLGTGLSMVGGALTANPTIPSGLTGDVQFNAGGSFGSSSGIFTFNSATGVLAAKHLDLNGGGQIAFPATPAPSLSNNTLDDYRENVWTPIIGGSGGSSAQTYAGQFGVYVKIGRIVVAEFAVMLSVKGTVTGTVQLQGFPFALDATAALMSSCAVRFAGLATTWVTVTLQGNPGTTACQVRGATVAATANTTDFTTTDLTNNAEFRGTLVYLAAS